MQLWSCIFPMSNFYVCFFFPYDDTGRGLPAFARPSHIMVLIHSIIHYIMYSYVIMHISFPFISGDAPCSMIVFNPSGDSPVDLHDVDSCPLAPTLYQVIRPSPIYQLFYIGVYLTQEPTYKYSPPVQMVAAVPGPTLLRRNSGFLVVLP